MEACVSRTSSDVAGSVTGGVVSSAPVASSLSTSASSRPSRLVLISRVCSPIAGAPRTSGPTMRSPWNAAPSSTISPSTCWSIRIANCVRHVVRVTPHVGTGEHRRGGDACCLAPGGDRRPSCRHESTRRPSRRAAPRSLSRDAAASNTGSAAHSGSPIAARRPRQSASSRQVIATHCSSPAHGTGPRAPPARCGCPTARTEPGRDGLGGEQVGERARHRLHLGDLHVHARRWSPRARPTSAASAPTAPRQPA